MAGLVANLAGRAHDKAIEAAGGFSTPAQPNRELRRRMEREAQREARATKNKGTP